MRAAWDSAEGTKRPAKLPGGRMKKLLAILPLLFASTVYAQTRAHVTLQHTDGSRALYYGPNSSSGRGAALIRAAAASATDDTVILSSGTYALSTTKITLAKCTLKGDGIGRTVITSSAANAGGPAITLTSGSLLRGLTIDCSASSVNSIVNDPTV